jgi:DNA-binding MarR family transcriptional regulator
VSDTEPEATRSRPLVEDVIEAMHGAFRGEMDVPAAAWDLTISQLRLMVKLRRSGALSMRQVAESFQVSQTAATGLVERVERRGFLERRHRSDDRRVVECHLTEDGNALLDELSGLRSRGWRDALAALTDTQLTEFQHLLRVMAGRRARATAATA